MGTSYNPKIVTDGLVLNLDAGNWKSYSGAGTSWTGLAQNKAVGVMTSCTFSSGNQGSIAFNGTSSTVYYPSNSIYSFGTSNFTIESLVTINSLATNRPIIQNDVVGTSQNDKWWLSYYSGNSGLTLGRHFTANNAYCAWTPVSGVWYHVAATRVSGLIYMYINGVSQSVSTQTSLSGVSFSQNGLTVGAISTPYYQNGNISVVRLYSKGLTSNEVLQNYNATKGRFGL
jgi:hypothetical protein